MVLSLVISCLLISTVTAEVKTEFQGIMFLNRFGYITDKDMSNISSMADSGVKTMMEEAIREYQDRNDLEVTGTLDQNTMEEMSRPRCGVKDVIPLRKEEPGNLRRAKRYVLGPTRWRSTSLSYRFIRTRNGNQARPEYHQEMDRAFRTWSSVSPLRFTKVTSLRPLVDIDIRFARRDHGDFYDFDGPAYANGPVLAHAFSPGRGILGDIHFDDEENWVTNRTGVDFFAVALHELGHAIGLYHSRERNAIMFASYNGYRPGVGLHPDDIAGIRARYGVSSPRTPPRRRPNRPITSGAPSLCRIGRLDAAFQVPNSADIYIFSRNQCYLLQEGLTGKTAEGYPRNISEEFPGVQVSQRIDAALAWPNGQVFLFEHDKVWILKDLALQNGSPQNISKVFPGIPDDLSAACLWPRDQLTYFFKGEEYLRYDNTSVNAVKPYYPLSVRRWSGVSGHVDAVLALDSDTYFFQGGNYSKYNNRARRVLTGYPRSTNENLFACGSATSEDESEEEMGPGLVLTAKESCSQADAKTYHSPCLIAVIVISFIITALGCEL